MSIKMMVLVRRRSGLTPQEFRDGYENSHSRIAVGLFGHLWSEYRRNYLIAGRRFEQGIFSGHEGGADEIGFDAISEYVLHDEAALAEMSRIATENFAMIKEDEAKWFDQVNCWSATCETIEEHLPQRQSA